MSNGPDTFIGGFRTQATGEQTTANYVWDTVNLDWVAETASTGTGSSVNITNTYIPVQQYTSPWITSDNHTSSTSYLSIRLTDGTNFYTASGGGGGNAAAGPTGSAVPSNASYTGFNSGGNLVGVSSSNPLPVTGSLTISNFPATQAVTGTFWQTTQPVSGTLTVVGSAAVNSTQSGNPVYHGGIAVVAANPTKATNGQATGVATDAIGRLITVASHGREQVGIQTTAISSTTETTVVTAIASTFCDITSLVITNSSTTATTCTLKDSTAGTTRATYDIAASGGAVINFNPPLPQSTVNNNWTITLGTAVTSIHVNVVYVKNT